MFVTKKLPTSAVEMLRYEAAEVGQGAAYGTPGNLCSGVRPGTNRAAADGRKTALVRTHAIRAALTDWNQTLDAEGRSFVDELLQLGDDSLRNILKLYATIYKCHGGRERKSVSAAECFFGKLAEMGCFYEPALAILITEFNQQFHATMNKTNAELGVPLLALVGSAQHTRAFSVGGVDLVRQLAVAVAVVYGQVYTAAASEMACLEALVCLVIKILQGESE